MLGRASSNQAYSGMIDLGDNSKIDGIMPKKSKVEHTNTL